MQIKLVEIFRMKISHYDFFLQIYSILNVKLLKSYELAKLKLSRNRRYPIYSEFTTVFLTIKADLLQHTRFPTHSKSTSHLMLVSALNLC